jgi:hypothetical protein
MGDDRESFDGWFEGVLPQGVAFAPEQAVTVVDGPLAGRKATIISLVSMGADPSYVVECEDGADGECAQS